MRKRPGFRNLHWPGRLAALQAVLFLAVFAGGSAVYAQAASRDTLNGVVQIIAHVPQDARTPSTLGTERQGTGVVIDDSGLVLTIGYLIRGEGNSDPGRRARAGAGAPRRLRSRDRLRSGARNSRSISPRSRLASAAVQPSQPLMVVSNVGELDAAGVYVVDRRDFAGYWEYLLEDAIFTAPPHAEFGGAALIDRDGRLVGIGSWSTTRVSATGRSRATCSCRSISSSRSWATC